MNNSSKLALPLAIVIAGAFIAWAVYHSGSTNSTSVQIEQTKKTEEAQKQAAAYVESLEIAPVTSADHILGSKNAKVTIIEYSDTECPYCKSMHSTLNQLFYTYNSISGTSSVSNSNSKNPGAKSDSKSATSASTKNGEQVAWVYRQYPIEQLHSRAPKEAEATECVAELGGNAVFWKYLNTIFTNTESNDTLDPAKLPQFADDVGVDVQAFNACLSSNKYSAKIKESVAAAEKAGASATPYTVILVKTTNADGSTKTERLPLIDMSGNSLGAVPYATMKAIVERLLNS